jgi:hypothetical protein
MKAIGIAIFLIVAAYLADQYWAQGKYTSATQSLTKQMRHSFGV